MISEILDRVFVLNASASTHPASLAVVCLGLALFLWRVVKFTILPALNPSDPREYPYWIPVVGHLRAFTKDSQALLTRARLSFHDVRDPFALTIGGQTFYIVTKAKDVSTVYRNATTLTFEIFAQEILADLGCAPAAINSVYGIGCAGSGRFVRALGAATPAKKTREMHHRQLFPGAGNMINDIGAVFVGYFDKRLELRSLRQQSYAVPGTADDDAVTVSLFALNSDLFTNAAQDAYFGQMLRRIEPDMAWTMLEYDDLAWQLMFKYPPFLSRKMRAAKDRACGALEKYFATPEAERQDTVWWTKEFEGEMRRAGLGDRDLGIMAMTIYWGASTNLRKGGFWLIAYLLFDPALLGVIQREIAPAFQGAEIDQDYLTTQCPRFQGAWEETMRITAFSSSVRFVTEDTVVGNKVLRKGYRIMMPYRQMHLDETVFGDHVEAFVSERFVKNPNLRKQNRTFGGGATQCPGRHLATHTILVFVAMFLHRFEATLDPPDQKFPQINEAHPVLGLVDVKRSSDLKVRLRRR